jgi:hypothetical protein
VAPSVCLSQPRQNWCVQSKDMVTVVGTQKGARAGERKLSAELVGGSELSVGEVGTGARQRLLVETLR